MQIYALYKRSRNPIVNIVNDILHPINERLFTSIYAYSRNKNVVEEYMRLNKKYKFMMKRVNIPLTGWVQDDNYRKLMLHDAGDHKYYLGRYADLQFGYGCSDNDVCDKFDAIHKDERSNISVVLDDWS